MEENMFLKVDKNLTLPLYKQILENVKTLIDQGVIKPNTPLLSTRSLAEKLGVSRTTVCHAYEELQAQGYLSSQPGSYNFVQKRMREKNYNPKAQSTICWENASSVEASQIYELSKTYTPERSVHERKGIKPIDFATLDTDPRLYPVKNFQKCVSLVLKGMGKETLNYGMHQGYKPLREYLAQRLRLHGIAVSEREILITNGAQQAIDLVTRLLVHPGRAVIVEAPTYAAVLPLFKFSGAKVTAIPMRENGLDLVTLEKVLIREKASFLYTIPNFQNPTGITTSHDHREQLLTLCSRYKVPLVEDGFEEDMKYYGKVDLPIKSFDQHNIVIYIGTFSKALFPGLRIGWITADRNCIERLMAIKRFTDLCSSTLIQSVMQTFCQLGFYDLHLRRLHRIFRQRMEVALKTMDECFPRAISWTRPLGGYHIWVKLPQKIKEANLYDILLPFGVSVSPGSYYFGHKGPSEYFRLSLANLNEAEIKEGIFRLGKALHSLNLSSDGKRE